ncbi:dihydroorotase family protein [uncultured Allofournierella sp.]|uniref:dihydroorotase n=1 Tax=uncultured Allofournierella sp. TaxID=1940258 RepID=UPI003750C619
MLIKNAKLSDGTQVDVLVEGGKIAGILQDMPAHGHEVIDAAGRTLLPGFIDLHCHWRTPGFEYKEDIASGSASAAAGGYTFVTLMPNTKPVCSTAQQAHQVMDEAERLGVCGALQTVSITEGFDGKSLDHLKTLPEDLRFITEDGKGVQNNEVMAKAFAICAQRNLVLMSHAEDMEISKWDYRLAENLETVRNLHLCEYYGARLHLCHVSTKEAVAAIGAAKRRGVPVTCEVTPHHLWFSDLDYRVNPPIRSQADVQALIAAIQDGTVDAIATDHAPHTQEEKAAGAAGMIGLETAFGVCYTKLCRENGLELYYLEALMSRFPAAILGLDNKGAIRVGADADLTLVDLDTPYVVDKNAMHSKCCNTPFDGATLYGRVDMTIRGGRVTYRR